MDEVNIDIEIYSRLVLTYDSVPLGHGVSQLASHPKVRQLGVTLHIEQNVASLEEIKLMIRNNDHNDHHLDVSVDLLPEMEILQTLERVTDHSGYFLLCQRLLP